MRRIPSTAIEPPSGLLLRPSHYLVHPVYPEENGRLPRLALDFWGPGYPTLDSNGAISQHVMFTSRLGWYCNYPSEILWQWHSMLGSRGKKWTVWRKECSFPGMKPALLRNCHFGSSVSERERLLVQPAQFSSSREDKPSRMSFVSL